MVGAVSTVSVGELLPAPAIEVCVVVTPDVVFGCTPGVLLVTTKVTVQLLLAGTVMPLKASAVAPAPSTFELAPVQVPPAAPPTALMLARVSLNEAPVNMVLALLLVNVSVTVEVPPL